jgi:hypothetical protein
MSNGYDGDPATGFMFGLYRYIGKNGHVNVCQPLYDEKNSVPYIQWDKYELEKLLDKANALRWPTVVEISKAIQEIYHPSTQEDVFKAIKLKNLLIKAVMKDSPDLTVSPKNVNKQTEWRDMTDGSAGEWQEAGTIIPENVKCVQTRRVQDEV